jgi:heme/copper-type cytochrome/quinol oxidase subunit 2
VSSAPSCLRLGPHVPAWRCPAQVLACVIVAALAIFVYHTPPAATAAPVEHGSSLGLTIALVVIGVLAVVAIVVVVIIRQRKQHRRSNHHGHGPCAARRASPR